MAKKKTTTARTGRKNDPEMLALARVTKNALAVLEELDGLAPEAQTRITEYITQRTGISITRIAQQGE